MHGRQADRGVFLTTSRFTSSAIDYARAVPTRIVLIDGQRLGELMVEYGCGVRDDETIVIKELDEDFFDTA